MPATEPGRIRNIAVVGHRGVGKTSLVEALLFQAGKTNRLGSIEQGTTVSDWDDDEHRRLLGRPRGGWPRRRSGHVRRGVRRRA